MARDEPSTTGVDGAQHDYRDARSTWPGASTTAAPTRSVAALAADDGGSGEPSLGDRLQGLVPDHGWSALRSLDGERSPQPVYFAAAGGREARWSARLAGADTIHYGPVLLGYLDRGGTFR